MNLVELLSKKSGFVSLGGATEREVQDAEKTLGVVFAKDFREYLLCYGAASYVGHEFTGICDDKGTNVVTVTIEERQFNEIPGDWYVIERADIEGLVYWQSSNGKVYVTVPNEKPRKKADSFIGLIKEGK